MKKGVLILFAVLVSSLSFAQVSIETQLNALLELKQYDKMIARYHKDSAYSAKALYYFGFAYFLKEDDTNALRLLEQSIAKSDKDAAPFFIKGTILNYRQRYTDAVGVFKKAIQLEPRDARAYTGLGDALYYTKQPEAALVAYNAATQQRNTTERPYSMIAQIYSELGQKDKALEAYYTTSSKTDSASDTHANALFNIGLLESLNEHYDKAEPALLQLVRLRPADFQAYAKLVQVYYGLKQYERAAPYRDALYRAYELKALPENMKDKFCFEQFKVDGKLVQGYERFQQGKSKQIYNKHIFYVLNNKGDVDYTVQTEYSPVSIERKGPAYLLCGNKGESHVNYGVGFNDPVPYKELHDAVVKIVRK